MHGIESSLVAVHTRVADKRIHTSLFASTSLARGHANIRMELTACARSTGAANDTQTNDHGPELWA